jgi:hypothetical protein
MHDSGSSAALPAGPGAKLPMGSTGPGEDSRVVGDVVGRHLIMQWRFSTMLQVVPVPT